MHRTLGCAHATTMFHLARLRARLADESGQGTVEYIALILLMVALFGAIAAFTGAGDAGKTLATKITNEVKDAIDGVAAKGGK